jgi:spore germination protein
MIRWVKNKKVKTKNNEKTRNNANTKNTENYKCGENTNNINANRIIDTSINLDNNMPVSLQLQTNLKTIEEVLSYSPDLAIRMLKSSYSEFEAAVFYIDGLTERKIIRDNILKPLIKEFCEDKSKESDSKGSNINITTKNRTSKRSKNTIEARIRNSVVTASNLKEANTLNECISEILAGNTVLLIQNSNKALIMKTPGWKTRTPDEPITEPSVSGPRDGFVETLQDNIVMLRRRIKDPNFSLIKMKLGRRTRNDIAVAYIKGIVNKDTVKEVLRRIGQIDVDQVIAAGVLEQFIEDNFLSPFPQIQYTERPDRVVAALMEGRVAILIDNTPFALVVPASLSMFMQSPEDYYERWIYSSLIRILRYLAITVSLFLPAVYVSLISFHQGLIPTKLAIFIASTREGVPLPSLIEAILMEITLEILREAGIRLPKSIGQAVGIVGGLVIGEAAVRAGIVSPVSVVVVSFTAIASFSVAQYSLGIPIRILRFTMMLAAGILGLYGVMLSFIMITVHLSKLKSFGVSYMSPFAPYRPGDWKDFIFRLPIMTMKKRPEMLKVEDKERQNDKN